MKYIVLLIVNFLYLSNFTFADDTLINGALDSIININVVTDNQLKDQVSDLRLQSTPPNGSTVARIYCDNNNYNGFSLTFVSDRVGRLVFFKNNEYPIEEKDGHYIPYTLDVVRGESGHLGLDMPDDIHLKGFRLLNPYLINFIKSKNVMHTNKKASLFHGVFQEPTVTITDL